MAIQAAQDDQMSYIGEYKEDFHDTYKISFDDAKSRSYPSQVIRAFDIFASVSQLYGWQGKSQEKLREGLKQKAMHIINTALGTEESQLPERFEKDKNLCKIYFDMVRLFTSGR